MKEAYKTLIKQAEAWIEAHKDEFISEIQGLVRYPSVSRADLAEPNAPFGPECRKVLDYALERGRHYGFETKDYDGYTGTITYGDADNAMGIIAHLDVVPVGEGWIYPPSRPPICPSTTCSSAAASATTKARRLWVCSPCACCASSAIPSSTAFPCTAA